MGHCRGHHSAGDLGLCLRAIACGCVPLFERSGTADQVLGGLSDFGWSSLEELLSKVEYFRGGDFATEGLDSFRDTLFYLHSYECRFWSIRKAIGI